MLSSLLRSLSGMGLNWLVSRLLSLLVRLHLVSAPEAQKVTRRSFVRNATLGSTAIVTTLLSAGTIRLLWPNKTGAFGGDIAVAGSSVPPPDGTPFLNAPGKFFIVHNDDGVMALYRKCPHLGCTVPWVESSHEFRCPCHGSIYDYDGAKVGGPTPRGLDLMAVTVESSGNLVVDTGDISQRGVGYDPSMATPYP
jgi:cytochrome b6-f complex iron-sulfur subunit